MGPNWGPKRAKRSMTVAYWGSMGPQRGVVRVQLATRCDGPGLRSHGRGPGLFRAVSARSWPLLPGFGPGFFFLGGGQPSFWCGGRNGLLGPKTDTKALSTHKVLALHSLLASGRAPSATPCMDQICPRGDKLSMPGNGYPPTPLPAL